MSKKWHESINWFWLFWFIFVLALGAQTYFENRQKQQTIQACIKDGRNPVIEHSELKECK